MEKKVTLLMLLGFLLVTSLMTVPFQKATDDLNNAFRNITDPTEKLPVIIVMKEQYDSNVLYNEVIDLNKQARREHTIATLKQFSETTQMEIRGILEEMERSGLVSNLRFLWITNVILLNANKEAIIAIDSRNDIERLGYDPLRQVLINNDLSSSTDIVDSMANPDRDDREIVYNVSIMNVPDVWTQGYTGQNTIVAVLDTGVNYNHHDIVNRMWTHPDYPNHGYNFVNNSHDTMDYHSHGTHCAGTVAGDGTSGSQTGVAPGTQIMALAVLNSGGSGTEGGVWAAIQFSVDYNADIMSLSLGWQHSWGPDRSTWRNVMNNALAAGVIASVAAGNEGGQQGSYPIPSNVRTPGDCPPPWLHPDQTLIGGISAVVSVGATDSSDQIANFSSRGPVTWQSVNPFNDYPYNPGIGLIRPDIVAPGVNVKSLVHNNNTGYTFMSGTSMATPNTAGVMALMVSKNPDLVPEQISQIIEETALSLSANKSNTYGSGRVDALAAVNTVPFPINGILEGTVTLTGGTSSVTEVIVQASYYSTNPDNTGFYQLTLPIGTYAVTASHPYYEPQTITNVVILEDETTSGVNFNLTYVPQPQIEVTPDNLAVTLDHDQVITEQLLVINDGEAALTFTINSQGTRILTVVNQLDNTIHEPANLDKEQILSERELSQPIETIRTDWLTISPLSGTVPAGTSLIIDVTFTASNLSSGEYTANLVFDNNSVVNVTIPVSMTVNPPPGEVTIGTGTNVNGTTTAAPINIYYRSLRGQMVYTATEINDAGFVGPGDLIRVGFYVHQTPAHSLPDFVIRMKHTTASNVATHDDGPFEEVYYSPNYTPVTGDWDMLLLDVPFEWNGVDNILVDTAFSMVPSWNSSGQQRVFTQTNGFRYTWSDGSDQTNVPTNTISSNKPQIRMLFADNGAPYLAPPTNLIAEAGDGFVNLSWTPPASRNLLGYNIYRNSGQINISLIIDPEFTDSTVVNGTTYSYYVKALYDDGESGRSNIVTARPSGIIYLDEDFTGVSVGSIPPDWTRTHGNWGAANSSVAGGETPELRFDWSPSSTDVFRVMTPLVALPGRSELILSFKHMVDHYSGSYTLKVQTSTDQTNWNTIWEISPTGNVSAQTVTVEMDEQSVDHLYFAWVFDGYNWNINYWYIDDIELIGTGISELPAPTNVSALIIDGYAVLSWDLVEGANSYKIYSTDDPFVEESTWILLTTVINNEFTEPVVERRFYKVTASSDLLPTSFPSSIRPVQRSGFQDNRE